MPDEPFQRAWSEDLLCPWRIYEDGAGHLNCPNGLDQGPVPDKDAINTLNQLHQSYYGVTLHVMPCAVCREMKKRFGNQRYEPFVARGTPDRNAMFSNGKGWPNQWDVRRCNRAQLQLIVRRAITPHDAFARRSFTPSESGWRVTGPSGRAGAPRTSSN